MSPTYAPYVTYTWKSPASFYVMLSWLHSHRWRVGLFWAKFKCFNWSPHITVFLQFPPPNPFWSLSSLPWYPIMYSWTRISDFILRWIKFCYTSWTHRNKQLKLLHTAAQLFITILWHLYDPQLIYMYINIYNSALCIEESIYLHTHFILWWKYWGPSSHQSLYISSDTSIDFVMTAPVQSTYYVIYWFGFLNDTWLTKTST